MVSFWIVSVIDEYPYYHYHAGPATFTEGVAAILTFADLSRTAWAAGSCCATPTCMPSPGGMAELVGLGPATPPIGRVIACLDAAIGGPLPVGGDAPVATTGRALRDREGHLAGGTGS
jgi:hypothetical protein